MGLYEELDALSESEAFDVLHHLRRHHNWQGTMFCESDLEDMWNNRREDEPDLPRWTQVRDTVLNSYVWSRSLPEWLVEKGNEMMEEFITYDIRVKDGEIQVG